MYVGNLESLRDWGHAKDYVEMQWMMLQQNKPEDFVIATGRQESVRTFIEITAKFLDWGDLVWEGQGVSEVGRRKDTGKIVVKVDSRYFRPTEVDTLLGDPTAARKKLGWEPRTTLEDLIKEMVESDLSDAKKEAHLATQEFGNNSYKEHR